MFAIRVLAEKAREYNTPLYLCFVDLKKAYDSVSRDALWVVLRKRYRIPEKLLWILEALHRDTRGAVRAYGKVSKQFPIKNGVRQGDVLAPILFNFFFDTVIAMAMARHPGCGLKVLYNQAGAAEQGGRGRAITPPMLRLEGHRPPSPPKDDCEYFLVIICSYSE